MPLTPADVHNVAFKKPSIGKRGYDEDEVDAFLDVVEAELARLIEENAELKSKTDGSGGGQTVPLTKAEAPMSTGEAHTAAARLLGLAQETADRLTGEARAEAEKVTGEANAEAEKTVTDAKSQAEALLSDAAARAEAAERDSRTKAENLDREAKSPLRRDPGQAGHRAGRAGAHDRGPARIREGVSRPAQELDQRSARSARRRRFPRAARGRRHLRPRRLTARRNFPGPAALRWIKA